MQTQLLCLDDNVLFCPGGVMGVSPDYMPSTQR